MDAAAINWTPLVIDHLNPSSSYMASYMADDSARHCFCKSEESMGGGRTCMSQPPSADNENQVSDYGVNQMSYGWLAGSGRLRCLFASVADISFVADYFVQ